MLQRKLVLTVLSPIRQKLDFFFEDKYENVTAPRDFVVRVLTNLQSALYMPHEVIVGYKEPVDALIFISRSKCRLYGFYKDGENNKTHKIYILRLRTGSWFGDFQIFNNVTSMFQLEAGVKSKFKAHKNKYVNVYKLPGEKLEYMLEDYPSFRKFLLQRALMRRSYMLKVLNENIFFNEVKQKKN